MFLRWQQPPENTGTTRRLAVGNYPHPRRVPRKNPQYLFAGTRLPRSQQLVSSLPHSPGTSKQTVHKQSTHMRKKNGQKLPHEVTVLGFKPSTIQFHLSSSQSTHLLVHTRACVPMCSRDHQGRSSQTLIYQVFTNLSLTQNAPRLKNRATEGLRNRRKTLQVRGKKVKTISAETSRSKAYPAFP